MCPGPDDRFAIARRPDADVSVMLRTPKRWYPPVNATNVIAPQVPGKWVFNDARVGFVRRRLTAAMRVVRARAWLAATAATLLAAGGAFAQPAQKVQLMIATKNTSQSLRVLFLTKGALARGLFLPFGAIGNAIAAGVRSDDYNKAIGPFDRRSTLVASIGASLERKYPIFEIVDNGATYQSGDERKEIIEKAKTRGIGYVLMVEDLFTGLTSSGYASDNNEVSAMSVVGYELYETAKGERLAKDRLFGNSLTRIPLEQALTDRAFIDKQMPLVHESIAKLIVGGLVRSDTLHRMAASAGQADQVPALGSILKRYEKPVRISMSPQPGWRVVKLGTPFAMLTEPKDERRFKMGVRTDVDVLISELGQNVDTLEKYEQIVLGRLAETGYDLSTVQEHTELRKDGYLALSVRKPATGGGQVLLFEKLNDTYVSLIAVIATEDLDGALATYKTQFQSAIDSVHVDVD
jgi:hypothetical protein